MKVYGASRVAESRFGVFLAAFVKVIAFPAVRHALGGRPIADRVLGAGWSGTAPSGAPRSPARMRRVATFVRGRAGDRRAPPGAIPLPRARASRMSGSRAQHPFVGTIAARILGAATRPPIPGRARAAGGPEGRVSRRHDLSRRGRPMHACRRLWRPGGPLAASARRAPRSPPAHQGATGLPLSWQAALPRRILGHPHRQPSVPRPIATSALALALPWRVSGRSARSPPSPSPAPRFSTAPAPPP